MLRPIPARILRSEALVEVCTGTDIYQHQVYGETYRVSRVHIQPETRIVKSNTNTDEQLVAVLFADCRHTTPDLDWHALLQRAHDNGGDLRVTVRGVRYTAHSCDALRDDTDKLHHWEIYLI